MNRFREQTDEQQLKMCKALIRVWGYPRELVEGELEASWWFRYGINCVFWFNPTEDESVVAFHVCAAPAFKGFTRRFITGAEIIAELIGAERVRVNVPKAHPELTGYLQRLGWRATPEGMTKTLGGE